MGSQAIAFRPLQFILGGLFVVFLGIANNSLAFTIANIKPFIVHYNELYTSNGSNLH